jgi:23S rRNA pseudouridine2605 synthase
MEQRIQKIISASGFCSRRRAEDLILAGKVTVNGKQACIGDKADDHKDKIAIEGKELRAQRKAYYLLNKPKKVLVARDDPEGRETIYDLPSVKRLRETLMHVGRLDYMSEGLIILTTDGDFANLVMHPRYEREKTYLVRVEPKLLDRDIEKIEQGMEIDGVKTSPAQVTLVKQNKMEITLHEGMNRVIRKMMEELGYQIYSLRRIKIGDIELGDLQPGKVRPLTKSEVQGLISADNGKKQEQKDKKDF